MKRSAIRLCLSVLFLALFLYSLTQFSLGQSPRRNSQNKHATLRLDGGPPLFKTWLEQDVVWIISPAEKAAFKTLQNDEQRDQFVEGFWERRDPTPDTYENEFKEEHYRRIAYANGHFGGQDPGWKTDRGRIYILYGLPDHTAIYSATDSRSPAQDGQDYTGLPGETWRYRYLEGVGMDVVIDFVDICTCGDYRMKMPDELRDALVYVPSDGTIDKKPETTNLYLYSPDLYLKEASHPTPRFPELQARLDSAHKVSALPLEVNTDISKATDVTSVVNITISFPGYKAAQPEGESVPPRTLNVVGRAKTLTGHVVELFEEQVTVDQAIPSEPRVQKSVPLFNARYRLEIAAEVAHAEEATTWTGALNVKP